MSQNHRTWFVVSGCVVIAATVIGFAAYTQHSGKAVKEQKAWRLVNPDSQIMRAVHMSGNWGGNREAIQKLPDEYFEYLRDLGVNWVGISVALHVDDSMDATVERVYQGVDIPTFSDKDLRGLIQRLRRHGFHVYLTLAFEIQEAESSNRPVHRYELGLTDGARQNSAIISRNWPWALDHLQHASFVDTFWDTYTEQAVHYAELAQQEGVELYSLGTETEGLFRTRSDLDRPYEFKKEIQDIVRAVRVAYSGNVTYDMAWPAPGGVNDNWVALWEDVDFDLIGLSTYYKLVMTPPNQVMSVPELTARWEQIFQRDLIPLKKRFPNKPIVFTEFGYVHAIDAPFNPASEQYRNKQASYVVDNNGNGLDDGQETQANIYESFFQTLERHPGVVEGAFTWMEGFPEPNYLDIWGVRYKLAENVVRQYYTKWAGPMGE